MATKTPIEQSLIDRAVGAFKVLTGKASASTPAGNSFFGPLQPPTPSLPASQQEEIRGRQFDFPAGANIRTRPRADEAVTFSQMRALADNCDILRLVIETRKDQLSKMKFNVHLRSKNAESDATCDAIKLFFARPDGENVWSDWLRMLLEEMMVTDAACLYPWMTNGGGLYRLELLDGATIKRVIDDRGRTPAPPDVAYQQILKGIPAVEYTSDELIYAPRNKRVYKLYGYSPVEQIIMTVNIAIRRQLHQLQYYTEGSQPDLLFQTPPDWNMASIKEFNDWWQDTLSGNTAQRRKAQFVPNGVTPINTKEAILKDGYDEWLARIVCYAFSVSPQAFVKEQNRSTSETAREQALSEGLYPMMAWVKGIMDGVIAKYFRRPDIEFVWDDDVAVDPNVQSQIDDRALRNGSATINEVRKKRGDEPIEGGDKPMVLTSTGYIDVIPEVVEELPALDALPPKNEPEQQTEEGKAEDKSKEKADEPAAEKISKAVKKVVQPINRNTPEHNTIREGLAKELRKVFKKQAASIAEQLTSTAKADEGAKDPLKNVDISADEALNDLFKEYLSKSVNLGVEGAYAQINLDDDAALSVANRTGIEWAKERSATLVGKKIDDNGDVIDNPDAKYSIDEATREMLRSDVTRAMEEGWSNDELAAVIQENYAFSDARAETIARTETANADTAGNEILYNESGVVSKKQWIVGDGCCDDCALLNGEVVDLDDVFSNGESAPPAHPNCRCDFLPVLDAEEQT